MFIVSPNLSLIYDQAKAKKLCVHVSVQERNYYKLLILNTKHKANYQRWSFVVNRGMKIMELKRKQMQINKHR